MSQSEPGWELITQAAHYSLPGIKYAACPWTWYSLSLFCVSLFLFPCLSFFSFFLSKGEHPHKPPLPHTFPHLAWQFPQLSRNRLSDIDTEGEPASKRLNFSPRLFFFFFAVSFWCIQPSRPYHLAPSPPVCVFTPKGQGVCSLVIVGVKCQGCVARQTEVFQRHTSNCGVWELSASVMYRGPSSFVTSIKKTARLLVC